MATKSRSDFGARLSAISLPLVPSDESGGRIGE